MTHGPHSKQQETLECGLKEEKEEKKEPYPHGNY